MLFLSLQTSLKISSVVKDKIGANHLTKLPRIILSTFSGAENWYVDYELPTNEYFSITLTSNNGYLALYINQEFIEDYNTEYLWQTQTYRTFKIGRWDSGSNQYFTNMDLLSLRMYLLKITF